MFDFPLFPEQASTFADQVDALYFVLIGLSLLFAVTIPFVILFFIIRYHRSQKADRSHPPHGSLKLELTWSIIPFFMAMGIFFWSAWVYLDMTRMPPDAIEVYVIGKRWMWHAQHPNGKRENNELHVPVGQPVKLIMTSQDVIHSFYVPEFRVKQDVLPGRYTTMWFEATRAGEYNLFCTEYCGTDHSRMIGRVVALPLSEYQRWLNVDTLVVAAPDVPAGDSATTAGMEPMAQAGEQLFTSQGCVSCHANAAIAPPLEGLFGSEVPLEDGTTVTADENYIRTAILRPAEQLHAGYPPVMPTYEGVLTPDQVNQLVEYIKSIGNAETSGN